MKKLDWYILKKFLSTFIFVLIILILIIVVIDYTEKNDNFMKNDVSGDLILTYYLTFMPYMASFLTPIIVFIATVFVTAKMASQTEIVAILASGISFRRMMRPYFVGAAMIAVVSFYFNSYLIPDTNKFRIGFELQYVKKAFYYSERNIHIKIGPSEYVYMDRYNNRSDVGYTVTLERIEEGELKEKLSARSMRWDTASHKWTLNTWQRRVFEGESERLTNGRQMDTTINVSPKDFENKERLWETLTMPELNEHIALQTERGVADVDIYKIEKYIRFMAPFTVIVLTFIGVIVSARKSRRGTGFQIALGFMIAFLFVIFFILARAMAEANTFNSPILAVWMPNILFFGVGLILYRTVPR